MTPMPMGAPGPAMPPQMPPMPSPEQLEEDRLIAEACSWEEISSVLHSDDRRNYTVDVETDATAFEDVETEKQQRIEYIRAMTEMMQVWIPAIQGNPTLAPFAKELAIFGSGAFKPGRQFEEQLGDAFDQIKNMPPQPNPEAEKLKAEQEREDKKFAMEAQSKQLEAAAKAQERQQDMAFKEREFGLKERDMQTQTAFKAKELQFKEQELVLKAQDAQMSRVMAAEQANNEREDRAFERQAKAEDREANREDRQYERQSREREFGLKAAEAQFKREDMAERRSMEKEDKEFRREIEGGAIQQRAAKHAAALDLRQADEGYNALRGEMAEALQALTQQIQAALQGVTESVNGLAAQQAEATEAITAIVGHMTAPRKVKRDGQGRAVGVEIGKGEAKALKDMLSALGAGGRDVTRDPKTNRIEGFA